MIKPTMKFNNFTPPTSPKYDELDSWAAHPLLGNGPEKLTPNGENLDYLKEAAVFYIHQPVILVKPGTQQLIKTLLTLKEHKEC